MPATEKTHVYEKWNQQLIAHNLGMILDQIYPQLIKRTHSAGHATAISCVITLCVSHQHI